MTTISQRQLRNDSGDVLRRAAAGELLRVATKEDVDHRRAESVLARVRLLTVDDTVGTWVRTADAIHLVCALRLAQSEFLTHDRVQVRGAGSPGMTVRSPGLEDGWWRS